MNRLEKIGEFSGVILILKFRMFRRFREIGGFVLKENERFLQLLDMSWGQQGVRLI